MAPNPSGKPIPDRPDLTLIALALGGPVATLPSAARFLAAVGRDAGVPTLLSAAASTSLVFSVPVVTFSLGLLLLHLRVAAAAAGDEPPPPVSGAAAAAQRIAPAAARVAATATLLLGAALFSLGF